MIMNDVIAYETGTGLYINLTNRCPCDCIFCVRKKTDGVNADESLWLSKEPSFDEIISAIDSKGATNYGEIVFCGYGEPTERLDVLLKTARYIKDKHPGCRIRLNTNGLSDLINDRPTAKDLSNDVDAVSISLNASNKDDYYQTCRPVFGEKSFDAMISFALDCKKHFGDTCFTIIDILDDIEISECKKLSEKLGIRLRIRTSL